MRVEPSQSKSAEELLKEQLDRMEHTWLGELKKQQLAKDQVRQNNFYKKVGALSPKHTQDVTNIRNASLKKIKQMRSKLDAELKNEITAHLEKQLQGRSFEKRVEDALQATQKPAFTPPGMVAPKPPLQFIEQKISQQMGLSALNNQKETYLNRNDKINVELENNVIDISVKIRQAEAQENKQSMGLEKQKADKHHDKEKSGAEELREKLARDIKERENNERKNSNDGRSR